VGFTEGFTVGFRVGFRVALTLGVTVGFRVGFADGSAVGFLLGLVGLRVGLVGSEDGLAVGIVVGTIVGFDGKAVGSIVGLVGTNDTDGAAVGELVMTCTTAPPIALTGLLPVFAVRMDTLINPESCFSEDDSASSRCPLPPINRFFNRLANALGVPFNALAIRLLNWITEVPMFCPLYFKDSADIRPVIFTVAVAVLDCPLNLRPGKRILSISMFISTNEVDGRPLDPLRAVITMYLSVI